MAIRTSKVVVAPLRGMDERWQVQPNQAITIRDMTWNDQDAWERAGGYDTIAPKYKQSEGSTYEGSKNTPQGQKKISAYESEEPPSSLHWFSAHGGALQWLVYETTGGSLRYFNGSKAPLSPWTDIRSMSGSLFNGTAKKRTTVTTPWEGTSFSTFASRLYICNGIDEPLVFDGLKADRAGFSRGPKPPDVVSTGKTSRFPSKGNKGLGYADKKGAYKYKVTFLNERGQESPASEGSADVEVDNTTSVYSKNRSSLTLSLPVGPVGTVARRVYRTQNLKDSEGIIRGAEFGNTYYFVTEIQDNVTTDWMDIRPDVVMGSALDESQLGDFPRSVKLISTFKNTMFVVAENSSVLKYSYPNQPEVFPSLNEIDLSDSTSGSITAMYSAQNALIVFKTRGIYLVKGDPVNGFFAQTLTKDTGCIASGSVRDVPGAGVMFMSSDGIYLLEGALENVGAPTQIVKISQPIRKLMERVNFSAAKNIRSVVYHRDKEVWMVVPTMDNTHANLVLKFHYEIGAWSFAENFQCAGLVETEDHRGELIIAANARISGPKGLYIYGKGYSDKGGEYSISPRYETADIALGNLYENFTLIRIQARIIGYGVNNINMNFVVNREMSNAYSADKTSKQYRPLEDISMPLYGTTKWDDGSTYIEVRPVPVRFDISTMHKGPVQEFRSIFETSGGKIQLVQYEIEAKLGERKKVTVLTESFGGSITR